MRTPFSIAALLLSTSCVNTRAEELQPSWLGSCDSAFDCEVIVVSKNAVMFRDSDLKVGFGHPMRYLSTQIANDVSARNATSHAVEVAFSYRWWGLKEDGSLGAITNTWWAKKSDVVAASKFGKVDACWPFKTMQFGDVSEWTEYSFMEDGKGMARRIIEFKGEVERYAVQAYTYGNIFLLRAMPSDNRRIPSAVWEFSEDKRDIKQRPSHITVTHFDTSRECEEK